MAFSLLFTGHMIDKPDRPHPRFPPDHEGRARGQISNAISSFISDCATQERNPQIIGFASAARGGDILFHEESRRQSLRTVIVLPFSPEQFVKSSVEINLDDQWASRFWDLWNETRSEDRRVLGLADTDRSYAECNLRLIQLARSNGHVRLIALWNGDKGDGVGGPASMIDALRPNERVEILSPN
jgi:hypothetical protein